MLRTAPEQTRSTYNRAAHQSVENVTSRSFDLPQLGNRVKRNRLAGLPDQAQTSATPAVDDPNVTKIPTWMLAIFGSAFVGLVVVVGALITIIFGNVSDDISDLKSDVKEIRTDLADLKREGAVTNSRLQTLIEETRKRR